ncbi:type II secretion system protein [Eleftheria terrae]|uniref:type II secretion system protein n=1 Tax=Eleftheria terrae TaxID=1597781 RepID=UPI00263AE4ED|nr:prepilin-type N-terminal cleavage/methylation domain-containing protein [Eleftheria terrae]WKB55269.1 type II secretion system GspH family protein [Eleftheria terrae]
MVKQPRSISGVGPARRGFTLIEMLVVMAVVALLMTVALPRYFGALERSKEVALQENLRVMRVMIDRFNADKGRYPEQLSELVEQRYLRAVPVDPMTESDSSWITVPSSDPEQPGIADVKSGARGQASDGRSFDAF